MTLRCVMLSLAFVLTTILSSQADTPIDLTGYAKDCQVRVDGWNGNLRIAWPTGQQETAEITLDLSGAAPLISTMAIRKEGSDPATVLSAVDPVWWLTVGERRG